MPEKFHRGAPATSSFEKALGPSPRRVLRLWPTSHAVDVVGQTPSTLWMAIATVERIGHPVHAFTLVSTDPDFAAPVARFTTSLQAQRLRWDFQHQDAGTAVRPHWRLTRAVAADGTLGVGCLPCEVSQSSLTSTAAGHRVPSAVAGRRSLAWRSSHRLAAAPVWQAKRDERRKSSFQTRDGTIGGPNAQ